MRNEFRQADIPDSSVGSEVAALGTRVRGLNQAIGTLSKDLGGNPLQLEFRVIAGGQAEITLQDASRPWGHRYTWATSGDVNDDGHYVRCRHAIGQDHYESDGGQRFPSLSDVGDAISARTRAMLPEQLRAKMPDEAGPRVE